ncbi:ferredoxin--NADP reductase [Mycobacterium talmoniae]|uniref:3-ketosteroid-9-alpha-monooxygenase, ferredoxin reductase component n=1 Tax=Mycobacterium talmoniae TaxID=1858794 RepID=A0A1S1NK59_9MYCO|nr:MULTISPECIES: ferredoxin--NADP reductase [Mycobacterium]OHV04854.1 oxidoreductase [Mycobacterium talmoniae]PQM49135.1 3-ketosteroid-9-alpha-monooxygenase, ferredoxin reductase component [Mycobacterium talmoniae]TDH57295.1 ferredoxin--NADP reductase [Mycobacterium eburneum]
MAITHVFQQATVTRIIKETADARTFVLAPREAPFSYRAGQYCTFRVQVDGEELYRSYSMSSAPETDTELMTTVKRVPGGKVSNWMLDNVVEGDELTMTRAAGTFCLDAAAVPVLGFAGGSGITPLLSLAKSALAGTDRTVRLLCADRDAASAIFDAALAELAARHPGRLSVRRHLDADDGLLDAAAVREFVGADTGADCYVCGPEGFMTVVRSALPGPGRVFVEDFDLPAPKEPAAATAETADATGTVTIHLERKKVSVPRVAGETLLESARRAGLAPPFSCEAGNCGTCMAHISEGSATMRVNDALDDDEVADGYILTCQGVPDTASITVHYE